jgi:hypothetical protein
MRRVFRGRSPTVREGVAFPNSQFKFSWTPRVITHQPPLITLPLCPPNHALNDIGIITLPNGNHLAIAVFVADSLADEASREAVIAKVARAVWERFATDERG